MTGPEIRNLLWELDANRVTSSMMIRRSRAAADIAKWEASWSRNNQRYQDVEALLAASGHAVSGVSGTLPIQLTAPELRGFIREMDAQRLDAASKIRRSKTRAEIEKWEGVWNHFHARLTSLQSILGPTTN